MMQQNGAWLKIKLSVFFIYRLKSLRQWVCLTPWSMTGKSIDHQFNWLQNLVKDNLVQFMKGYGMERRALLSKP